jgi:capsular exopolysaccharide synthesis family protein
MQPSSEPQNLQQALRIIRRRLPLVLLCVVVVTGAAYGFSKHEKRKYTATASLAFSSNSLSSEVAGLSTSAANAGTLAAEQADNLESVRLGDMAAKTASALGSGLTEEKVEHSLTITGEGESGVVAVSATAGSPALAAAIANTYTHQFVVEQRADAKGLLKSALALVDKQLAALAPKQRVGADGLELQDRAQTLTLLSELDSGNVQVAQEAVPPVYPSSPKTARNVVFGLLLGLLLGLGLVFLMESLDRRIRGPEDLAAIYELPLLGAVRESGALAQPGQDGSGNRQSLPPADAEAFGLIRAHLRFFNVDRDLRTLVIASPGLSDGKTTIARHLAEAAARAGSRVLIIEADLRQPALATQLGIDSGPGLADVLCGAASIGEAIRPIEFDAGGTGGAQRPIVSALVAGSILPPNPAELLESSAMDGVLERARSVYDLVVIDTPPLTVVSDAFPLLAKADGVVIVGRIGRSRRDAARRLHDVLANSGVAVLGVIANGAKLDAGGAYVRKPRSRGAERAPAANEPAAFASSNGASGGTEDLVTSTKI